VIDVATDHSDGRRTILDRAGRVVVPAALAVLSWLVLLVAVALFARADATSLLDLLPLIVVPMMGWPLARAAPWRPGVTDRAVGWARANRRAFAVGVATFALRWVPGTPGAVVTLVDLPFRTASVLFGVGVVYRQWVGPAFGSAVFRAAQLYLVAFWLYGIGTIVVDAIRRLRP
jgi:hypothetical protein